MIPVAIARHPAQALPHDGSWFGKAQDYLGMTVNVAVRKLGDVSDPSEEESVRSFSISGSLDSPPSVDDALRACRRVPTAFRKSRLYGQASQKP
jgi:hypothetical protein